MQSEGWEGRLRRRAFSQVEHDSERDSGSNLDSNSDSDSDVSPHSESEDTGAGSPPRKKARPSKVSTRGYKIANLITTSNSSSSLSYSSVCPASSHVDASQPCPSSPTSTCIILDRLRMSFGPHGFTCWKCHQLVSPGALSTHINRKIHQKDLTLNRKGYLKPFVSHLLRAHGVPEEVTIFPHPDVLPNLIPGLKPILSYKCPACPRWTGASSGLATARGKRKAALTHFRKSHGGLPAPEVAELTERYIMRPYCEGNTETGGPAVASAVVITLPEGWVPLAEQGSESQAARPPEARVYRQGPAAAPQETFLTKIGWPRYVVELGAGKVEYLRDLVEIPNNWESWIDNLMPVNPRKAIFERGLLALDGLIAGYLRDANEFLNSCHPSVRRAVTSGYADHTVNIVMLIHFHFSDRGRTIGHCRSQPICDTDTLLPRRSS